MSLSFEITRHTYGLTRRQLKAIIKLGKDRYNQNDGHYLWFEVKHKNTLNLLKLRYFYDHRLYFDSNDLAALMKFKTELLAPPKQAPPRPQTGVPRNLAEIKAAMAKKREAAQQ